MKIQCDVCFKAQATVMCCADEAALCSDCDTRVHAANKLASKHQRVPLVYPAPEESPSCDICQEKTGYFFCVEDRALLCRNCDFSIHSANSLASNHRRFLVTGIRVALAALSGQERVSAADSAPQTFSRPSLSQPNPSSLPATNIQLSSNSATQHAASLCSNSTVTQASDLGTTSHVQQNPRARLPAKLVTPMATPISTEVPNTSSFRITPSLQQIPGKPSADWGPRVGASVVQHPDANSARLSSTLKGGGGAAKKSSISEYLTETIPGWRVDELLNLPDMGSMFNFSDYGKADTPSPGDLDWAAELGVLEDDMLGESPAEVPSFPSPPTASGFPKPGRFGVSARKSRRPDMSFFFDADDILVVPDTGGQCSPTSPTSLQLKRRRVF